MKELKIGSRESRLAVVQSQLIIEQLKRQLPDTKLSLVTMKTTGDKILDRSLDKIGGKGLFVKELDQALLDGRIDLAVHSLKDMPGEIPEELPILAYSKREDPSDVLILPKGETKLNPDKPIGCSSLRRTIQLKKLYPHMEIKGVRGNVLTRLEKLDSGQYSALVLAAAGIKRLGLEERISRSFTPEEILPAAGQGILAVQGRASRAYPGLCGIDDKESRTAALCERAFIRALNGGCTSPVAAYAVLDKEKLTIRCLYEDGSRASYEGPADSPEELGRRAAGAFRRKEEHKGKVWLVGAGPSDPGLFTIKGQAVLEQADVVVYDRLVGAGILAMIPAGAKTVYVGKSAGSHPVPQEEINRILLKEAKLGRRVVRLKGGDPFIFGRGGEELELLAEEGIPFEIVPGITSPAAVPAYQGIPATYRDYCSSLHFITGHKKENKPLDIDFEALVRTKGTLVFLMGLSNLEEICRGLVAGGMDKDMPAAVLAQGTTAGQKKIISTVEQLPLAVNKEAIQPPALIVVGQVVTLSEKFDWYRQLPLAGCKAVVTRPKELSSTLTGLLRAKGADVVEMPCIQTEQIRPNPLLDSCLAKLDEYRWIVLTSPAGARIFFDELADHGIDIRSLYSCRFAVIGSGTGAVLKKKGLIPDLLPSVYNGRELGRELAKQLSEGDKVLIPRARQGAPELLEEISRAGVLVEDIPTYDTVYTAPLFCADELFGGDTPVYALFTSASTVKGFVRACPELDYRQIRAICIGEKTGAEAMACGMQTAVSDRAAIESLADCLEREYHKEKERR